MDRTIRWPRWPWFLYGPAVALVPAAAAPRILTVDADPQTADVAVGPDRVALRLRRDVVPRARP